MSDTLEDETAEALDSGDQAMLDQGINPTVPAFIDYFGTDETYEVELPDGYSVLTCKQLTEGDRKKYQKAGNKEVRVHRQSGDAFFKIATPEEREALLEAAIVGWNLQRSNKSTGRMEPVSCTPQNVKEFLNKTSPTIIDIIEKAVRKHEPWLTDSLSVEDIDKQIEELQEIRQEMVEREEGKAS